MSHYAKVVNGVVTQIICSTIDDLPKIMADDGAKWIPASSRGIIGGKNEAIPHSSCVGIGDTYDENNKVFYSPKPFQSWSMNETTWLWEPPNPMPNDGSGYLWVEELECWLSWIDYVKRNKCEYIKSCAQSELIMLSSDYPDVESSTWNQQAIDAQEYLLSKNSSALLQSISDSSNTSLEDLSVSIVDKFNIYSFKLGAIIGKRIALYRKISESNSIDEVMSVSW
jgi:hypothetical protein